MIATLLVGELNEWSTQRHMVLSIEQDRWIFNINPLTNVTHLSAIDIDRIFFGMTFIS